MNDDNNLESNDLNDLLSVVSRLPQNADAKVISLNSQTVNNQDSKNFSSSYWPLWFWNRHSKWSSFGRGLFWGSIVSLTSMASASLGAALTSIDSVSEIIVENIVGVIERNEKHLSLKVSNRVAPRLTRPVNILLVEIEPTIEPPAKSPTAFVGNSKTILLLQFRPHQQSAKVINIPADSLVQIPGLGWSTLSNANKYGGVTLVAQTVSQMTHGMTVDRYIRATPATFNKLIATLGKVKSICTSESSGLSAFNSEANCSQNYSQRRQLQQQQIFFEAFRQRLNSPTFIARLSQTVQDTKRDLDTNISLLEIMAVANFVKNLDSDSINVTFLPSYRQLEKSTATRPPWFNRGRSFANSQTKSLSLSASSLTTQSDSFYNTRILVQNTTDNPELGMEVISYLLAKNFKNVYLVDHIPLKLERTQIVVSPNQLKTANYIHNILGLGRLKFSDAPEDSGLTIRIGEDARYLTEFIN